MGGRWLASYPVTGYTHRILALGGFDTASCAVTVPVNDAETFLNNFIACVVRIVVDNPLEPIWEGYLSRITYQVGATTYTRSTDQMNNRNRVTYFDANAATPQTTVTTVVNNPTSQAVYGVKTGNLDAGVHYNSGDITHLTTLRDTANLLAYPIISSATAGAGGVTIQVEMQGLYYFAYDWNQYQSTTTTLTAASNLLQRITIGADKGDNASFVVEDTTAYSATADLLITSNTSFNMTRESRTGQTFLQFIQSIVEAGDGTQQWAWGITALDPNSQTRRVYYQPAATAVSYRYKAKSDVGRVRDIHDTIVPGWKVRPDAVIQVTDVLTFWQGEGDDPRLGYIMAIDYDGETGQVSFQTGDNITMEGALGTNRYFRRHGGRLNNAPVRTTR